MVQNYGRHPEVERHPERRPVEPALSEVEGATLRIYAFVVAVVRNLSFSKRAKA